MTRFNNAKSWSNDELDLAINGVKKLNFVSNIIAQIFYFH